MGDDVVGRLDELRAEGDSARAFTPINPSHYRDGEIECIDAIRASLGDEAFIGYCAGNMIKYKWRAGQKGDPSEDHKKAEWYAMMARHVRGQGPDPRGVR